MEIAQTKTLLIALVEKNGAILMRKKPAGSPPYSETWYMFGCERIAGQEDAETLREYLDRTLGITVDLVEPVGQGEETKKDHDGMEKRFVYMDFKCRYKDGEPRVLAGAERLEWIPRDRLADYDIVPPSAVLLRKLGYLQS